MTKDEIKAAIHELDHRIDVIGNELNIAEEEVRIYEQEWDDAQDEMIALVKKLAEMEGE